MMHGGLARASSSRRSFVCAAAGAGCRFAAGLAPAGTGTAEGTRDLRHAGHRGRKCLSELVQAHRWRG